MFAEREQIGAIEPDRAAIRFKQTQNSASGRGFATTGFSNQPKRLAFVD
jgi:hypothetical protein